MSYKHDHVSFPDRGHAHGVFRLHSPFYPFEVILYPYIVVADVKFFRARRIVECPALNRMFAVQLERQKSSLIQIPHSFSIV